MKPALKYNVRDVAVTVAVGVSEQALHVGRAMAEAVFKKRSKKKGEGRRNVEIHLGEGELATFCAIGYEQGYKQGVKVALQASDEVDEVEEETEGDSRDSVTTYRFSEYDGFRRHDALDSSTIYCPCGETLTWTGLDERLEPWAKDHKPHQMQKGGG